MTGALPPLTLVLGGARSGKSRHAETRIEADGRTAIYVATGEAGDEEMAARIQAHRARRGDAWQTVEVPLELSAALAEHAAPDRALMVDCLTLWLTNVMLAGRDVEAECMGLIDALPSLDGPVVLVSNEVGLGIVPADKLTRDFRDHAGRLHQDLAAIAQSVVLVVAGLPHSLKPLS